jgi:hypothetical protein
MMFKLVALLVLSLMAGTAVAQDPKVTSLMSKDLPEDPGREALTINCRACARRVERHSPDTMHMRLFTCWRAPL